MLLVSINLSQPQGLSWEASLFFSGNNFDQPEPKKISYVHQTFTPLDYLLSNSKK